jgi:superfamily II DNA helicase RecQ
VVVNHDTWNDGEGSIRSVRFKFSLYALEFAQDQQGLKEKRYRIILTSPEICLGDSGFATLFKDPRWSRSILFMVVDEAHYIKEWGAGFRKYYASLGSLRSFVPRGVPILATSATMPPTTLEHVRHVLEMNAEKSFHLNLGNDRRNTVPLVWPMEGGASNLAALDFVVCGRDQPLRTIIYFNSNRLTMLACNHLRKLLPPSQAHTVDVLHASRGPCAKKEVIERFRTGKILVLCSTGVVGMVRTFALTYSNPIICCYRERISWTWMTSFNS